MEPKSFRLFLLTTTACFILIFTSTNFTHAPSSMTRIFDCTNSSFSHLCSTRNFLFNKHIRPIPKNNPKPNPKNHDHLSDTPKHPLDPLTLVEIQKVRSTLSSHALFASRAPHALHSVVLEEPDKNLVRQWEKGNALPPRKASVIARVVSDSHVLTVDLSTGHVDIVDSPVRVLGFPVMTVEEMSDATWAPFSNTEFNRTIISPGLNLTDVICFPISSGWYGNKEETSRLIKIQCYLTQGTANFYMQPIEGLTLLYDLDTKQILEVSDTGRAIPIPSPNNTDYRFASVPTLDKIRILNPISMEQPRGPSFVIEDNHLVKWANWEFHLKPDPRAGLIISRVRFHDPDTQETTKRKQRHTERKNRRNTEDHQFVGKLLGIYRGRTSSGYFDGLSDGPILGSSDEIFLGIFIGKFRGTGPSENSEERVPQNILRNMFLGIFRGTGSLGIFRGRCPSWTRDVMYKGFVSELFVPYMDPSEAWYFKTYMDAGEYGFGLQAMPLEPLNDCPRNAVYMDGIFAAADGTPYVRENMICVFESYAGDIAWRHSENPVTGLPVRFFVLLYFILLLHESISVTLDSSSIFTTLS
ncbi:hypothetical protein F2Q69_00021975 [Brassica cretica]|uniref:Amine oxidase n=1 Tax=Brassica cretica TaxID=69181 RepID=A0A8S9QAG3_BRACR|nr:hypothetical protein F2Q69_00021975 [Brassica cretica]